MNESDRPIPVTLRDVAREVGVSHTAISLALRDSPRVAAPLRKRIGEVARRMGYQPNATATILAHYKRGSSVVPIQACLAWLNIWPEPQKLRRYHEFEAYWTGAQEAAIKLGYRLEEFVAQDAPALHRVEKILLSRGIQGILIPPHPTAPEWDDFSWERFSTVRFGRSVRTPRVHMVASDQTGNAMLAVEKMVARGYQRIGYVTGSAEQRGALFTSGFLMAQSHLPLKLRLPVFHASDADVGVNKTSFLRWLKLHKPDGILTDMAEVAQMLEDAGYRVPQDVGLAALSVLDGNADAGINQNSHEIGRVAVLLVSSLITDHSIGIPPIFRQVLVDGTWVDGDTLPLRGKG